MTITNCTISGNSAVATGISNSDTVWRRNFEWWRSSNYEQYHRT
jgi:hypothetical protein